MAATRSDVAVRQDVADALTNNIQVTASNVGVEVQRGVVYLRGTVPSLNEKLIAANVANRIKGVREVINELQVAPATPRTDQDITNDVRAALVRDVWVDADRIGVRTENGVAYLSGTVDSYAAKSYAESDARTVPGVVGIVDDIVVSPVTARTDQEIADEVRTDLSHDARIDCADVAVDVRDGVVHLRGTIPTAEQRRLAAESARRIAGVRDVVDELRVALRRPSDRAAQARQVLSRAPGLPFSFGVIPPSVHGFFDYVLGVGALAAPRLFGFEDVAPARLAVRLQAAAELTYSLFTGYSWGVVRVLPFRTHLLLDALGGAMLALSPWLLGFRRGKGVVVGLGLLDLAITLLTKQQVPVRRPSQVAGARQRG